MQPLPNRLIRLWNKFLWLLRWTYYCERSFSNDKQQTETLIDLSQKNSPAIIITVRAKEIVYGAAARNTVVENAKQAPFMFCLDADNVLAPGQALAR